ncbi:crinkler (CRN) family protein, putative [Phytophthora infestans T30-4]|uniref:Crinkler (CRN) family protein, putative n=1 Tax=Phytophthora infestans (strain T30-4) TaxID=403677 RepID=D0RLX4_PHYIT|nr:crinkler (CRN) family protein, putative [Phytophthora infestans T30-4]EEY55099.1 crinkler (CRN) family protein, putative [Phytophthora infestans T30-4]|eukprot:XP_002909956.1 crinkler (CRN) family protein, putative [Phytophthora infestans T30-4]
MTEETEVKLRCGVYGEGSVFFIEIKRNADVDALQKAIFAKIRYSECYKLAASDLTLYLARKEGETVWLEDYRHVKDILQGGICTGYDKMRPSWKLNKTELFGPSFTPGDEEIHVLVELPTKKTREWSAEELSTVDPQVQRKVWKSAVRVSSDDVCSGSALVVDRTATHVYLLTNLHLWVDKAFTDDLSADFNKEIKQYLRLHPGMESSGTKRKAVADASELSRKFSRTSQRKAPFLSDKPQVVIEQYFPDSRTLEKVLRFSLDSGVCWSSSAAFDFAIFKVAAPQDVQLTPCKMSTKVYPTMDVHVFGFPGALPDHQVHRYAIIPATVTGWNQNQMTLSSLPAPGLSGSAIVCTKRGVLVGYIGGGFDGSTKNERYQSYGFTLRGIPPDLPSRLPPADEDETKE